VYSNDSTRYATVDSGRGWAPGQRRKVLTVVALREDIEESWNNSSLRRQVNVGRQTRAKEGGRGGEGGKGALHDQAALT